MQTGRETATKSYSAGGSTDLLARAIQKVWTKYSPQPIVVVNKTGAGAIEGREFVLSSKPDGYTLVFGYGSGEDLVNPHQRKVPYDVLNDFIPVARMSIHSTVVAVPASSPFTTMQELIDWAKKENQQVTAAVSAAGGTVDMVMRGIGKVAGIQVVTIPHGGDSQAVTSLVGGQTTMGGGAPSSLNNHIKAGRLRPLAVSLPVRDPSLPDVPTLKEAGVDFSIPGSVKGVAAPKGTPPEVIKYLEETLKKVSEDEEFKKIMADLIQPIMYQNSKDFTAFIKQSYEDYGKQLKELDIKLN